MEENVEEEAGDRVLANCQRLHRLEFGDADTIIVFSDLDDLMDGICGR